MRLKSYTGMTTAEAMALVRAELGPDAIIVSTQRGAADGLVRVTAALEEVGLDDAIAVALTGGKADPVRDRLAEAFAYHGVPRGLTDRLLSAADGAGGRPGDARRACAAALDALFPFAPLPETGAIKPFLMVGPPGSGKSLAVAKLAARARIAGREAAVITADAVRAGAMEQLAAFTDILQLELKRARGPEALQRLVAETGPLADLVLIDTPGLNPFKPLDIEFLAGLAAAAGAEPILVMAAGADPAEAGEIAGAFAEMGATRLFTTRLDLARRLGGMLAAADMGGLMFADVSIAPHVAGGLAALNPVSLARLLVPPVDDATAVGEPEPGGRLGADRDGPIPSEFLS